MLYLPEILPDFMITKNKQIQKTLRSDKTIKSSKKISLRLGAVYNVIISSQGPNGLGVVDFTRGYSILVPNAQLGDKVQIKIVKMNLKKSKYALAKLINVIEKSSIQAPVRVGDVLVVTVQEAKIQDKLRTGISESTIPSIGVASLPENYTLIIPNAKAGDKVQVEVTKVKAKYAFAKIVSATKIMPLADMRKKARKEEQDSSFSFKTGTKFNIVLPKKVQKYANLIPVQTKGKVVFIKLDLGAQLGKNVRIKITKQDSSGLFAFAKVIKLNPISSLKKKQIIKNSIAEMLKNGMHFGEKAVKCHARMKDYVWLRKKGRNKNRALIQKGIHFINLLRTRRCLNQALKQLSKYAAKGRTFLFVGTKKSASALIPRAALFSKKAFFVNTRWLGGMLTNWKTILKSISKIKPILKEKQRIIQNILAKRQNIKNRLISKMVQLRKKSKTLLKKGLLLIQKLKGVSHEGTQEKASKREFLLMKRKEFIQKGQLFIEKRQLLLEKRKELLKQSLYLQDKSKGVRKTYKQLLVQFTVHRQKLRELKSLFYLSQELQKVAGNKSYTVSYKTSRTAEGPVLPNPPKEILNKIISVLRSESEGQRSGSAVSVTPKTETQSFVVVLSKLLSKFTNFSYYLKNSINAVYSTLVEIQNRLFNCKQLFVLIEQKMAEYVNLKNALLSEFRNIKMKLSAEQKVIKLLKRKLHVMRAEKRFLKLLPKLRHLPIPMTQISEIVNILMKKFVDPRIKYASEAIYDQKLRTKSKKTAAARKKKWQRLEKYFGGVANLFKTNALSPKESSNAKPWEKRSKSKSNAAASKNVAIIIGQREEMNAVFECQKLGMKTFHIVDTDCNPTLANHFVPANDDSRNSIKYILTKFLTAIRLAQKASLRVKNKKHSVKKKRMKNTKNKGYRSAV